MTVAEDFSRVHARLDELVSQVSQQGGRCERCLQMIDRHEMAIDGSNGAGLKARMAAAEVRLETIGDPAQRATVARRTSIGTAIGAVVYAVANWIWITMRGG